VAVESTRTNKDFVVKQGLKVATGVTFPDNSVQTTAFTGSAITVGSSFPGSPSNGAMHLDTSTSKIYYYYNSQWNALANYDDTQTVIDHTHSTGIDEGGFLKDTYQYNGNGVTLPAFIWETLDGGTPATTSFASIIDGGAAA
jgi:hypothetical protein